MRYMLCCCLLMIPAVSRGQLPEADRAALLQKLDGRAGHYAEVAQQIWGFAEVGYQETRSAALLKEELRAAGFTDRKSVV